MKLTLIAIAVVAVIGGVVFVFVLVRFGSTLAKAHGETLYTGVGAWTRIAEFAHAQGKSHYIAEADENLRLLTHDLRAWRETAPSDTDFAALEKLQSTAYDTTDRNIKNGQNPLAHLDEPGFTAPVTVEEIIRSNADKPVEESIAGLASSLAEHRVLLATDDTTAKATRTTTPQTQPTTVPATRPRSFAERVSAVKKPGITIEFESGKDAQGRVWAYAYTSRAEFDRAYPPGRPSTELSFRHFLGMIDGEPHFAGIRLNPGSDVSYTIPRELFGKMKERWRRPADG